MPNYRQIHRIKTILAAYLGQWLRLGHVNASDFDVIRHHRIGGIDGKVAVREDERRIEDDIVNRGHIFAEKLPRQTVRLLSVVNVEVGHVVVHLPAGVDQPLEEVHPLRIAGMGHVHVRGRRRVADSRQTPGGSARRQNRDERRVEFPREADAAVGAEDLRDDQIVFLLVEHVLHLLLGERDLAVHSADVGDGVEVAVRALQLRPHELEGQRVGARPPRAGYVDVAEIRHRLLLRQRRDRRDVVPSGRQFFQQRLGDAIVAASADGEECQDPSAFDVGEHRQ